MSESVDLSSVKLVRQELPFGKWNAKSKVKKPYRSYRPNLSGDTEKYPDSIDLDTSLQLFVSNPTTLRFYNARDTVVSARGTEVYHDFFNNTLDRIEDVLSGVDDDTKGDVINILFMGIDDQDSSSGNLLVSKKIVETIHRLVTKPNVDDDLKSTAEALIGGLPEYGHKDNRYLIYRGIIEFSNSETGKTVAGFMMARYGVSLFLDNIKQIANDPSLPLGERDSANQFLLSFWDGIVPIKKGEVVFDWRKFYDEIPQNLNPMTEKKEGDRRVNMLIDLFQKIGIRQGLKNGDLILDIGTGTGWLPRRLEDQLYNIVGVDNNDGFLAKAREMGVKLIKGSFDKLYKITNSLGPVVEIIQGRTIMHFKRQELLQLNAPVVIFDCLDPETGSAKVRLDKFRDKLTEYGFDREWLSQNFWNLLGSIDGGDHLGERLALPEHIFRRIFSNYRVDVTREKNYDGQGTDNLVYVCTKDKYSMKMHGSYETEFDRAIKNGQQDNKNTNSGSIKPNKFYVDNNYAAFGY